MPHAYTHKRRKRSKWGAYNRRRAADLEADRRRRSANRQARQAEADVVLVAEYERTRTGANTVAPSTPPPLRVRIRLDVVGHGSHQITATWDDYARQWHPSKRSLLAGLAELLKAVPRIAGTTLTLA